jgi:pimeloyl-ACP methyl ester carboxylesterase
VSKPLSLDLPPGAESISIATPRGPIAAITARPHNRSTEAHPPALLVPGFTGSKEDFLPSLGALAESGRFVVAYDQRGQYETGGPDDPNAYTVPALAEDLLTVATHVGAPLHLVGHSFGGIVARAAVIERPEAFRSLTLLGSGPAGIDGARRVWLELMAPIIAEGGVPQVWAALEAVQAQDPRTAELPVEIREFLKRRFLAQPDIAVQVSGQALLDEPDRVDELRKRYAGPVLVAYGAGDDAWPPPVQEDMAARLGVPHIAIPDSLHSPAAENPEATAKVLIEFWDEAEATGS